MAQKPRPPRYEPNHADVEKHKRNWDRPVPGLRPDTDGHPVGKCPDGFELRLAQRLLDEGIHHPGRFARSPFPERIYNVHQGVPYHAHQKEPGRYHGFPERPSRIPPTVRDELRERARAAGDLEAWEQWELEVDGDAP